MLSRSRVRADVLPGSLRPGVRADVLPRSLRSGVRLRADLLPRSRLRLRAELLPRSLLQEELLRSSPRGLAATAVQPLQELVRFEVPRSQVRSGVRPEVRLRADLLPRPLRSGVRLRLLSS